jgi:hypothetical protein
VAQKLQAILLIPVLVALVLGGVRVKRTVDTWQSAKDAVRVAELVQAANKYASDAIDERDVSVIPLVKGDRGSSAVAKARHLTDADAKEFDAAVARTPRTDRLQRRIELVRAGERRLSSVRAGAFTSRLSGVQTEESYHAVQHPLMEISNELGFGITSQATYGRTLYAVSLTQAAESLIRAIGTHLLVEDRSKLAKGELQSQLASFSSYVYLEQVALQEYAGFAGTAETARLREALADAERKGEEQSAEARTQAEAAGKTFVPPPGLARMTGAIASGATADRLAEQGITPQTFFAASTLGFDAYRSVEVYLTDTALTQAHTIADDARNDAIVNAVLVLAAVLAAFLLATWVARTMSTSMRLLSASAHEIAGSRCPADSVHPHRSRPGRRHRGTHSDHHHGRDRRGRPRLRPRAPRSRPARRRAGPAARQHQHDPQQPGPSQPVPDRGPALHDHRTGGQGGRPRPVGEPLPARPPRHPRTPQRRVPPASQR